MIEDISIFNLKGFLFIKMFLREVRQGADGGNSFALSIVYIEMVSREFLGPANLAKTQTFYIY